MSVLTITEELGRGSSGRVYRATDLGGLKYAVKEVPPDGVGREECMKELHFARRLDHTNIMKVNPFIQHNVEYLLMPECKHSLANKLDEALDILPLAETYDLASQVADALAYLHNQHIVHRDINPSNILLTDGGCVKIVDLGIACLAPPGTGALTPNRGNLWYRAPEVLFGSKNYSTPVDMWSFGCVFTEMALGKPLLPGRGDIQQINLLIDLLGTPSAENWREFEYLEFSKLYKLKEQPEGNLTTIIDECDENTKLIICSLIRYEPCDRMTASVLHQLTRDVINNQR